MGESAVLETGITDGKGWRVAMLLVAMVLVIFSLDWVSNPFRSRQMPCCCCVCAILDTTHLSKAVQACCTYYVSPQVFRWVERALKQRKGILEAVHSLKNELLLLGAISLLLAAFQVRAHQPGYPLSLCTGSICQCRTLSSACVPDTRRHSSAHCQALTCTHAGLGHKSLG